MTLSDDQENINAKKIYINMYRRTGPTAGKRY